MGGATKERKRAHVASPRFHRERVLRADHGARIDEPADVVDDAHVRRRNREEGKPSGDVRAGLEARVGDAVLLQQARGSLDEGARSASQGAAALEEVDARTRLDVAEGFDGLHVPPRPSLATLRVQRPDDPAHIVRCGRETISAVDDEDAVSILGDVPGHCRADRPVPYDDDVILGGVRLRHGRDDRDGGTAARMDAKARG